VTRFSNALLFHSTLETCPTLKLTDWRSGTCKSRAFFRTHSAPYPTTVTADDLECDEHVFVLELVWDSSLSLKAEQPGSSARRAWRPKTDALGVLSGTQARVAGLTVARNEISKGPSKILATKRVLVDRSAAAVNLRRKLDISS